MDRHARKGHNFQAIVMVLGLALLDACGGAPASDPNSPTIAVIAEPMPSIPPTIAAPPAPKKIATTPRATEPRAASNSDDDDSEGDVLARANGEFDRQSAAAELSHVDATLCSLPNAPNGPGHVVVTFSPTGMVSNVQLEPPFRSSPVGVCLTSIFSSVAVAPFKGSPVRVGKSFFVP